MRSPSLEAKNVSSSPITPFVSQHRRHQTSSHKHQISQVFATQSNATVLLPQNTICTTQCSPADWQWLLKSRLGQQGMKDILNFQNLHMHHQLSSHRMHSPTCKENKRKWLNCASQSRAGICRLFIYTCRKQNMKRWVYSHWLRLQTNIFCLDDVFKH